MNDSKVVRKARYSCGRHWQV